MEFSQCVGKHNGDGTCDVNAPQLATYAHVIIAPEGSVEIYVPPLTKDRLVDLVQHHVRMNRQGSLRP